MISGRPVAITGMGCICAAGSNLEACMASLFAGIRRPTRPTRFETTHPEVYPVFEIPESTMSPIVSEIRLRSLTSQLGGMAVREALNIAAWTPALSEGTRIGVCMGTTVGAAMNDERFYRRFRNQGNPGMRPIKRFLRSNPADVIGRDFNFNGPVLTVVNACCSGTDAIGIGSAWIRQDLCDMVVAGGTDELCRVTYNGFASLMITDTSPCRPFDKNRKGLNLGEGAAVMILESEQSRKRRGVPARAYVSGYGTATDAFHITAPRPDGSGLKKAISDAFHAAGKAASDIGFVSAHGTGTYDNDLVEARVIDVMVPETPFLSTKGYTGHTLGAAGAIQAVFSVACLLEGKIPKSAGFSEKDPDLPGSPVTQTRRITKTAALSQSLAFGGNNSALVFETGV